jgi:hypothetical protein
LNFAASTVNTVPSIRPDMVNTAAMSLLATMFSTIAIDKLDHPVVARRHSLKFHFWGFGASNKRDHSCFSMIKAKSDHIQ